MYQAGERLSDDSKVLDVELPRDASAQPSHPQHHRTSSPYFWIRSRQHGGKAGKLDRVIVPDKFIGENIVLNAAHTIRP